MNNALIRCRRAIALAAAVAVLFVAMPALALDAGKAIEQALAAAKETKRGITLHVNGQQVSGAVVSIEPGQWVELRSQQYDRIIVRIDRIDAYAQP